MDDVDRHLMTIFSTALDRATGEERAAYLEAACGGDEEQRGRVEALLRAHEHAAGFLALGAATGEQATTEPAACGLTAGGANESSSRGLSFEASGTIIGPYKLLQPIGEGGMGTVYMAEQTAPVKRMVALKVIKPGMDSRQVLARFNAERQALALMDHPNIAKVLDAGATEQGRPYFVMELVKGVPITQYCDERRLNPRERLELFILVCQAVQHAHQKGIIHRDIKPTNVMVALYDGTPVPKVIDFGVAKATGDNLTAATLYTGFGAVVGTPEYMSPEQAELNQLDIDTRSDIYSLGVLLYELLTGTTPLQHRRVRDVAVLEILRLIREEEPPRPSRRLSSTEELPSIAANRSLEPRKLSGLLRGDLDWIAMRALEKDRNRRYATANGLAADLRRYLDDEPVTACPPTLAYRLRKLVRRNRPLVLATSLIALSLMGGLIGTTWGMLRASAARGQAEAEAREKTEALEVARRSQRNADEKLFGSYVDQARANRLTQRPGQRFESLGVLRKAIELARKLELPDESILDLRNHVIATLALPDLHLSGPWNPWPVDGFGADFDAAHLVYARTDRQGNCSVRRLADDVELHRLPGIGLLAWPMLSRDARFLAVLHYSEGVQAQGVAVQLWDLAQSPARRILSDDNPRNVVFHPNSAYFAIVQNDGAIRGFELPGGRLVHHLPPVDLTREVKLALHPTEPLAALCSYFHRVVQIRDLRSGEVIARLPQDGNPDAVEWHPSGRMLAVGLVEAARIQLYDRESLQSVRVLQSDQTVTSLGFNHAGDRLASRGWGEHVELFDIGTGRKLFGTGLPSLGPRFDRDDLRMGGAVKNGRLGVYDVADGRESRVLSRKAAAAKGEPVFSYAVSRDGRLFAAGIADGFGLWDLVSGTELAFISTGNVNNHVHFEPSGSLLVLCPTGLMRWPISGPTAGTAQGLVGPPERLALPRGSGLAQSRDGRVIVTCARAVGLEESHAGGWILHTDRSDPPIRIDPGADIGAIAISPDGRWVVTFAHSPAGLTRVWDAQTGDLVKELAGRGSAPPQFSADGRWLSTGLEGGRLMEVSTWELGPRVGGAGAFAPDGRSIAIPDGEGGIRLVDIATGRELATLEDPKDPTTSPVFSPDGGTLIGVAQGEVPGLRVWDLRLVRKRLDEMGLDWDAPGIPAARESGGSRSVLSIRVVPGTSHYDRGVELAARLLLEEAAQAFRLALESDPNDAAAHHQLGRVLFDRKRVEEAIEHLNKSIALDSTIAAAHNDLGLVLVTQGDRAGAIACFQQAVALAPTYAKAYDNLGRSLQAEGRFEEAIAAFRTITELEPRCALHANLAAWVLATCPSTRHRNPSEAVALARRAVDLEPRDGNFWNTLGVAYYRAGEWKAAIQALEKARNLQGDAQISFDAFFLAMSHKRLGNTEEARGWFNQAVVWMDQNAPQDEELKRFRAEASRLLGMTDLIMPNGEEAFLPTP